jgi:hypothetical protein
MRADIPYGGGGNLATTTVEVLETPAGTLQQAVQALTQFSNHAKGQDVHYNVRFALRTIKTTGAQT